MSNDILRADPRLRRVTLIVLGIAVMAALLGIVLFQQWLRGLVELPRSDELIVRLRQLAAVALTGSGICLALLAGYSAHKGTRAIQFQQWPLPGARVIRDTPVRRGPAAVRIGRRLQVVAGVGVLLAIATSILSWRILT